MSKSKNQNNKKSNDKKPNDKKPNDKKLNDKEPNDKEQNNKRNYEETREWRIQNEKKDFPLKKIAISILIILIIMGAVILLVFTVSQARKN